MGERAPTAPLIPVACVGMLVLLLAACGCGSSRARSWCQWSEPADNDTAARLPPRETSKPRPTGPARQQKFLSPFRQSATLFTHPLLWSLALRAVESERVLAEDLPARDLGLAG